MLQLIDTKQISSHYMSAIINNDYSGIDNDDEKMIDEFLKKYPYATLSINENESSFFGICDICKLYSDVYDVNIYQWRNYNG